MKPQHSWVEALEGDRRVPDYALQVAAVFMRYADNPDDAWVTFRRLVQHTHQHRDKVSKSLNWLRDNGWLKVLDEGRGKRTHYRLTVPVATGSGPDGRTTPPSESGPDGRTTPDGRTGPDGRTTSGPDGRTTSGPDGRTTNELERERRSSSTRSARAGGSGAAEEVIKTRLGCTDDEAAAVAASIKDKRPDIRNLAAVLLHLTDDELREYLDAVRAGRAAATQRQAELELPDAVYHDYRPSRGGECLDCGLGANNRRHRRAA